MSKNNAITIDSYDKEYQVYIQNTANVVTGSIKTFLDKFLTYVDRATPILEIGSGTGRDATYIEDRGFKVIRTDAAPNFVKHMIENDKHATVLDITKAVLDQKFSAILANAVFVHFDDEDFNRALENVKRMLKPGGIFALSVHKGVYRGMSDHKHSARYFQDRDSDDLRIRMCDHGFKELAELQGVSVSKRRDWHMLILQKSSTGLCA